MSSLARQRIGVALGLSVLVWQALEPVAWAESPPPLRFDPFRERIVVGTAPRPAEARRPDREFQPLLLSTVVGGERPLVNLGGVILGIGEETHGYRLIEVKSFEATFEKEGETLRLEVAAGREGARRER